MAKVIEVVSAPVMVEAPIGMTKYARGKLNTLLKVYLAQNTEKNTLEKTVKKMGDEIKTEMGKLEMDEFIGSGVTAKINYQTKSVLDEEAVAKLLGRKIPESCYKKVVSPRLTVRAA